MAYIKLEDLQNFPIRIDHYDKENGNEHFVFGIESVIEYAEHLPTADVVEVVRCKNCTYWDNASNWTPECRRLDGLSSPKEDDFCSYGERRTNMDGGKTE